MLNVSPATLARHSTHSPCNWAPSVSGTILEVNSLCVCGWMIGVAFELRHTHIDTHTHTHTHTDNWVHRLVQNKSDGKLVEVSGRGEVGGVPSLSL